MIRFLAILVVGALSVTSLIMVGMAIQANAHHERAIALGER